jgi:hypothetical protein
LKIPIISSVGVLRFDLDFKNGALRRIIFYVYYPYTDFFAGKIKKSCIVMQINVDIDFIL